MLVQNVLVLGIRVFFINIFRGESYWSRRCDCVHRSFTLFREWNVSVAGTECWFS